MRGFSDTKVIGLTGMSGAGKSTVSRVFREKGLTVIDCDAVSRRTADKREFLDEVSARFSEKLLNPDGSLNRPLVAKIIYGDKNARAKYQRIIFPYIVFEIIYEIKTAGGAGSVIVLDAPTLFESGLDIICEKIVSVCADRELCEKRIRDRDKLTSEQARERLSSQKSTDFFKLHSDFLLENNSTAESLKLLAEKTAETLLG